MVPAAPEIIEFTCAGIRARVLRFHGAPSFPEFEQKKRALRKYGTLSLYKISIISINEQSEHVKAFEKKYPDLEIIPISCLTEEGIDDLKAAIYSECKKNM